METIPARTVNERGFTIYDEFADTYGTRIRVQESSSATGPRVWIFADPGPGDDVTSPHLDLAQAQRVRDALAAFIEEWQETLQAESLAAADLPE